MNVFPTSRAYELPVLPEQQRWLIKDLWADEAVGVIGGEPKSNKSVLALDMSVAVASGTPCLGRFETMQKGRVLVFAAEDAQHVVRSRLDGLSRSHGVDFETLDVHVITAPSLRLDLESDRRLLVTTVELLKPKLLVLDPFVRLHRRDENVSAEVAPLLAHLRELQRCCSLAVVLVHHAKKGASHMRGGQALRGSSELHAWGDSNLYLGRTGSRMTLVAEHRAAACVGPLDIELHVAGELMALRADQQQRAPEPRPSLSVEARVRQAFTGASGALTFGELRAACRIRTQRLYKALAQLTAAGQIEKTSAGYRLRAA